MRKKIIDHTPYSSQSSPNWYDLEAIAQVELSSEHPEHPIENALAFHGQGGWWAAVPGEQTLRLLFDEPRHIRRIHLVFSEHDQSRTQEFLLRWARDDGSKYREILRQQFHFSPPDTTLETEDYSVDLLAVRAIELRIIPNISGGNALATLGRLRIA